MVLYIDINVLSFLQIKRIMKSQCAHICRTENTAITKKVVFAKPSKKYCGDQWREIADLLGVSIVQTSKLTQ